MNKLLIANWKMNGDIGLLNEFKNVMNAPNLILALPYPLIPIAGQLCGDAKIASQDCSVYPGHGAYTGEISADMLRNLGATYIIVGHSERRNLMHETSEAIRSKIKNALIAGHKVIYCVSEKFEQQINNDLISIDDKSDIMVAYEPISAIGTGATPVPQDIDNTAKKLHKILGTKVLYGGSVTSKNIMEFCSLESIDGVLVGGAGLKISEVEAMLLQIQNSI